LTSDNLECKLSDKLVSNKSFIYKQNLCFQEKIYYYLILSLISL